MAAAALCCGCAKVVRDVLLPVLIMTVARFEPLVSAVMCAHEDLSLQESRQPRCLCLLVAMIPFA